MDGKIIVRRVVSFEIDPLRWAREYCVTLADAVADVEHYFTTSNHDGNDILAEIIGEAVPALRNVGAKIVVSQEPPFDRGDWRAFFGAVPQRIDLLRIVEVAGFRAGSIERNAYAAATALTRMGRHLWSTHILVRQDDRPDYPWTLQSGNYFGDERAARADLSERLTRHIERDGT